MNEREEQTFDINCEQMNPNNNEVINDSIRNQNLLNIRKNINHNNLVKRNTSLLL
jgi:hypothetical protein